MVKPINILIIEDHQVFSEALQTVFETDDNFNIKKLSRTRDDAFFELQLNSRDIDVIILDLGIPKSRREVAHSGAGIEVITHCKKNYPKIKILILSSYKKHGIIKESINSGADGYLLKEAPMHELRKAITAVNNGDKYFQKEIEEIRKNGFEKESTDNVGATTILTTKEKEIIKLMMIGKTSIEIAGALGIGKYTVEEYKENIRKKLGAINSLDMIRIIYENNISLE